MNVSDLVKFSDPMNSDEATERFIVRELRGPRVLVEDAETHMAIKPTFVYLLADLAAA